MVQRKLIRKQAFGGLVFGDNAFLMCTALQQLTIPARAKEFSGSVCVGCDGLTDTSFDGNPGIKYLGTSSEWITFASTSESQFCKSCNNISTVQCSDKTIPLIINFDSILENDDFKKEFE